MAFLLDSNVFIQSKNEYYAFDVFPGFWDWLDHAHSVGSVFSVEKVREELLGVEDELAAWAVARPTFFLAPDEAVIDALRTTSEWVNRQRYEAAAMATFLQGADFFLVGHALAHGHTVVTQEKAADTVKRIKIPNACAGLGVAHIGPFEMLRGSGVRFVLEP